MEPYLWEQADVLVIDNKSSDHTVELLQQGNAEGRWPQEVMIIQPTENRGYSGSQKLAYWLMLEHSTYEWVLMLHGDGQYDPKQIKKFWAHANEDYDVVYGFRSWRAYWSKDETPWTSYITIKTLSFLESWITGYWRKEWHSGMVMYRRRFLERINFKNITSTMHIDGHLLFAAGVLKARLLAVPIYKRYKNYAAIGKTARVKYVFDVLRLLPRLKKISVEKGGLPVLSSQEHVAVPENNNFVLVSSLRTSDL